MVESSVHVRTFSLLPCNDIFMTTSDENCVFEVVDKSIQCFLCTATRITAKVSEPTSWLRISVFILQLTQKIILTLCYVWNLRKSILMLFRGSWLNVKLNILMPELGDLVLQVALPLHSGNLRLVHTRMGELLQC